MPGLTKKKKIRRVLKQVADPEVADVLTTTEEFDEDEVDGGLLSRFTDIFSGGDLSGQGSFIGEGMGGVDGRIESPMTTIEGTVAPMDRVEEDSVAKWRDVDQADRLNPFVEWEPPTTPLQEKQEFMGREDEYQRKLRESKGIPGLDAYSAAVSLGFPADVIAASINALVKGLGGPESLIQDPVLGSRWLIENGVTVNDIVNAAKRDMETIQTVTEPIIQQLPYEEQRQTILTEEQRAAEQGLLVEDEEEIVDEAASLLSPSGGVDPGIGPGGEPQSITDILQRQKASFVNEKEIQEVVDTGLDPERIYADFSQDIAGKRNRYLAALNEMYKKVAILNVIASLTNSPSQATAFMKLASDKFQALEGFADEERYQKIAQGVFFREDGSFDAPKSKEEAFNRAIQFGATHDEAIKLSGHKAEPKTTTSGSYKTWHNPTTGQSVVMAPGQAPRGADGQILEGWFPGEPDSGTEFERMKASALEAIQDGEIRSAIGDIAAWLLARDSMMRFSPEEATRAAEAMVTNWGAFGNMTEDEIDAYLEGATNIERTS
jgi:hypothetical protein